jgi:hypothetical protein
VRVGCTLALECSRSAERHVSDVIKGQHRSSVVAANVLVTALHLTHDVKLLSLDMLDGREGAEPWGATRGVAGSASASSGKSAGLHPMHNVRLLGAGRVGARGWGRNVGCQRSLWRHQ